MAVQHIMTVIGQTLLQELYHLMLAETGSQDSFTKSSTYWTWNVRGLYQPGKMQIVMNEWNRNRINIVGLSEIRWTGKRHFVTDSHTIIYFGMEDRHEYGVAVCLNQKASRVLIGSFKVIGNGTI